MIPPSEMQVSATPITFDLEHLPLTAPKPRSFTAGSLPVEILINILPMLAQPELARMLRVSREVHLIALPFLYTDLTIDLNRKIHPISSGTLAITDQGLKATTPPPSTSTTFIPLPDRFTCTKHLTIVSHDRRVCATLPGLIMPNLISLRIQPTGREDYLDLCIDGRSIYERPMIPSPDDHTPCCPLVASLYPQRLILGDCTTGLTGAAKGLWPYPRSGIPTPPFPSSIHEIIILVGMLADFELVYRASPSFLDSPPSSVEKVTFVPSCGDAGWKKIRQRGGEDHPMDDQERAEWALLWRCTTISCGVGIEIVLDMEVDSEGRVREDEEAKQSQANFRASLERFMISGGRGIPPVADKSDAARRAKAMQFVDEHGFRKREPWYAGVVAASMDTAMKRVDWRAGLVD